MSKQNKISVGLGHTILISMSYLCARLSYNKNCLCSSKAIIDQKYTFSANSALELECLAAEIYFIFILRIKT